ncbi:hypothetical protein HKBW3S09_02019, partial [Candidatus Hakubella thermalkaliphila]
MNTAQMHFDRGNKFRNEGKDDRAI